LRSGTSDEDLRSELIYFIMAKMFNFTPEEVDKIEFDRVIYMIHLNNEWVKRENDTVESQSKRRR
jgi:hypothetical protein